MNGYGPVVNLDAGVGSNTLGQGVLYLDNSKNVTIENIDFNGLGNGGIYLNGVNGFTLRHSRVTNFLESNGVFSTGNNVGTILFENVETGFNGGDSGPNTTTTWARVVRTLITMQPGVIAQMQITRLFGAVAIHTTRTTGTH